MLFGAPARTSEDHRAPPVEAHLRRTRSVLPPRVRRWRPLASRGAGSCLLRRDGTTLRRARAFDPMSALFHGGGNERPAREDTPGASGARNAPARPLEALAV
ncbi:hypothetical protein GCM10022284_32430 [Streptomyces hundungensis]